jgi:hypothetical protein
MRLAFAVLVACAIAGCSGPPSPRAIAFDEADGALLLVAGTFDRGCEDASAILFECGRWELFVHLAPAAQSPGARPLASADTWAQRFVSDGRWDAQECSLYGDVLELGTVAITGSDAASVAFTIAGTATGDFDADGSYGAARCEGP